MIEVVGSSGFPPIGPVDSLVSLDSSVVCQIIERALIDRVHIMVTHFCFFGGLHFLSSPLPNFGERAVNIRLGAVRVQGS